MQFIHRAYFHPNYVIIINLIEINAFLLSLLTLRLFLAPLPPGFLRLTGTRENLVAESDEEPLPVPVPVPLPEMV